MQQPTATRPPAGGGGDWRTRLSATKRRSEGGPVAIRHGETPNLGQPYESVTITATPHNYVSPVNYSWTVNGAAACRNESTCSAPLGDQATYTYFHVTASDAVPSSAGGDWSVFAEWMTPPCDNAPRQGVVRAQPAPGGQAGVHNCGCTRARARASSGRGLSGPATSRSWAA